MATVKKYKLYQKHEWVPVSYCTPEPYDLVLLALDTGSVVAGWWTGTSWDGHRLKSDTVVKAFKAIDFQVNNSKYSLDPVNIRKRKCNARS